MKSYESNNNTSLEDIIQKLEALTIPVISKQKCNMLNRPISNVEIEEKIFQLVPHKALGPDGILAFFFQEFWNIV